MGCVSLFSSGLLDETVCLAGVKCLFEATLVVVAAVVVAGLSVSAPLG